MPAAWRDASFDHLRANGAFLVSGVREGGRSAWVRIESLAGEPCTVIVPGWQNAVVRAHSGAAPSVTRATSGAFTIDIAKGASVVLAPDATSPLSNVAPVTRAAAHNPWPWAKPDTSAVKVPLSSGVPRGSTTLSRPGAAEPISANHHRSR